MPFDTDTASGFAVALFIEFCLCELCIMISVAFLTFYVCISTYFRPCVDDLSAILAQSSDDVTVRVSMKGRLVQFVELHLHFYRLVALQMSFRWQNNKMLKMCKLID